MKRGITLIALIITIIILIILVAVTIKAITHDGLVNLAVKASENYKLEEKQELEQMNGIYNMLDRTLVVTAEIGTVTTKSIQVIKVSAINYGAWMSDEINYSYYIKKSMESNYPDIANKTGTEASFNFENLSCETNYDIKIKAVDKAGNTGVIYITGIKTKQNTAPKFVENSVKITRNTSKMSIEMIGADVDEDDITYTLEWGTNTNYGKSKHRAGKSGEKVTMEFDNVGKTDNIYWKLVGSDGIDVTNSKTGTSTYCSGYVAETRKCTKCKR